MSRNTDQKIRLLVLYDILSRQTDEIHPMHADDLLKELQARGLTVTRRVIPSDIALLNEYGYEVLSYKKKYYYYYVAQRPFDKAEAIMLADVVRASKLTKEQKERLLGKLADLSGVRPADKSPKYLIVCDEPKRSNRHILYSIDVIERAIEERKQISFLYYSLNAHKQKIYRREGKRYTVNPIVMVWSHDNYYLLCYDDTHEGTATYRIDRMEDVRKEARRITEREEYKGFDAERYRREAFSMFGGEREEVKLCFLPSFLDEIYDRFGEEVHIEGTAETAYTVTVTVQISPTFFGWVAGSRGKVRIISPDFVQKQFDEYIREIKAAY